MCVSAFTHVRALGQNIGSGLVAGLALDAASPSCCLLYDLRGACPSSVFREESGFLPLAKSK